MSRLFLLLLYVELCIIFDVNCLELFQPQIIEVANGDTLSMKSKFLNREIYDSSGNTLIAGMTGRAYCVNDICSIPGVTLIVYPGITFNIALSNEFDFNSINLNDGSGPDIINIHSHGLHISAEQDNVFDVLYPQQSKTWTWTIHSEHHIGSNWYHSHHHQSAGIQVSTGMYGALIVDKTENYGQSLTAKSNDYIICISWQYLFDKDYCNNCNPLGSWYYFDDFKMLASSCYQWCSDFSSSQRSGSGYQYDIDLNGEDKFEAFFVNNQYQPTISTLKSNEYFKLRILSTSSSTYIQLEFDYSSPTDCTYFLTARDGIAIQDEMRDLSQYPYEGYFLLPPGGRIDVLVLCTGSGVAEIKHYQQHPTHSDIHDKYPMGSIGEQILFILQIESSSVTNPTINQHLKYPEPPNNYPYYIQELIDSKETYIGVEETCECSNYDRYRSEDSIVRNTNKCAIELVEGRFGEWGNGKYDLFEVNGIMFDTSNPEAIYTISLNKIYEFYINSDGHPFHIHTNPFIVQDNLLDGYVAKQYDIMDTLGYNYQQSDSGEYHDDPDISGFHIRYNTRDFVGNAVLHCHFLDHEDLGMMAFMKIIDDDDSLAICQQCNSDAVTNMYALSAHANKINIIHTDNNNIFQRNQYYYSILITLFISIVINMAFISIYCFCNKNKPKYYHKVSVLNNNDHHHVEN